MATKSLKYDTRRLQAGDEDDEKDIDRLRAQAERLGIHIDGRWGAARLRQEIAKAKL